MPRTSAPALPRDDDGLAPAAVATALVLGAGVCALAQETLVTAISAGGAIPDLPLAVAVVVARRWRSPVVRWWALCLGLLLDLSGAGPLGAWAFLLAGTVLVVPSLARSDGVVALFGLVLAIALCANLALGAVGASSVDAGLARHAVVVAALTAALAVAIDAPVASVVAVRSAWVRWGPRAVAAVGSFGYATRPCAPADRARLPS